MGFGKPEFRIFQKLFPVFGFQFIPYFKPSTRSMASGK